MAMSCNILVKPFGIKHKYFGGDGAEKGMWLWGRFADAPLPNSGVKCSAGLRADSQGGNPDIFHPSVHRMAACNIPRGLGNLHPFLGQLTCWETTGHHTHSLETEWEVGVGEPGCKFIPKCSGITRIKRGMGKLSHRGSKERNYTGWLTNNSGWIFNRYRLADLQKVYYTHG